MTRNDDREWITPECLTHGARRSNRAELLRDVPIRACCAGWNRTGEFIDSTMKGRHLVHIENHSGEVTRLPTQQGDDPIDCRLNPGRRRNFVRVRKSLHETLTGIRVAPFGKLHACDAARGPRYAAAADDRIEQCKRETRHQAPDLNIGARPFTWRILLLCSR